MFRNKRGFTLIEFLVAIVIMMVGLLGLLQAVNLGLVHNLNTQLRNEAVAVADWHLARQMSRSFDTISTSALTVGDQRPILRGFKVYSVARSGTVLSNSKQVNITVSWRHKDKRYTHEASSVASKYQ